MRSIAHGGRIGGLAVALGVGAALFGGHATAWADPTGSTSSDSSGSSPTAGTKTNTTDSRPQSGVTAGSGTSKPSPPDLPTPTSSAGPLVVTSPPVLLPTPKSRSDAITETSPHLGPKSTVTTLSVTNDVLPSRITAPQLITRVPQTLSVPSPALADTPVTKLSAPVAAITPTLLRQQAPVSATPADPISVITGVVTSFVQLLLNPLAANNLPATPADTPLPWSLLAFARREFETIFAPQAASNPAADTVTTSQPLVAQQRTLVLSAMPVETDAILARTTLDPNPTVVVDGHHFYLGTLGGKPVIVAMTGIGEVNAAQTTEAALDYFTPDSGISIDAVIFDGVAGGSGRTEIGDVAVPARWTSDGGATWDAVDSGLLAAAGAVTVDLDSTDSIVDHACRLCGPLATLPLVNLQREPQLYVGGDGSTSDNNNGVAFPEIPLGGPLFGPQPLAAPDFSPLFTGNFFQAIVPFLVRGVLSNITGFFTSAPLAVDAVDQETAAAQQVADAHGVPFLGIRGMSDGPGDPLPLPGYPVTFLVFNQVAADNAAIVTQAVLADWADA